MSAEREEPTREPGPATTQQGGPLRRTLTAVVALSVIAVAGVLIYRSAAPELSAMFAARPWPAVAGASSPAPEEEQDPAESSTRSPLVVVRVGKGNGKEKDEDKTEEPRPVVLLGSPTGATTVEFRNDHQVGILSREILRQALLLAARDELGLVTRDQVLGDMPPADAGRAIATAEFASSLWVNRGAKVVFTRGDGKKDKVLLKRTVLPGAGIYDLIELTVAAEKLSRTDFPKALQGLGLAGQPNATNGGSELPAGVEDRLARLGFTEPLAAVRDLHAAIRKDGESPERLGALVRGYALLGTLTEFQWNPAHKAFKARALLYAQRLIARDPKSPWGLWHRAFAEALAGLHARALSDLTAAKTLAEAPDAKAPHAPPWLGLIEAFARYDRKGLEADAGSQAKLAALLRMLAREYPQYDNSISLDAAREVVQLEPDCFRAHDVMCQVGGVANLHTATTMGPAVLDQVVPRRLQANDTLPADVREPIERQTGEIALVDALRRAGAPGADEGEPSWGVVGHLIRETRFVQLFRRLYFMRHWWNVSTDDYWFESRRFLPQHRFLPYLDSLASSTPEANRDFVASFDRFGLADLETDASQMITALHQIAPDQLPHAWAITTFHSDHLVRDFSTLIEQTPRDDPRVKAHYGWKLLGLSPNCPFAMATLVDYDWENCESRVVEWEKTAGDFPVLLAALGRRYSTLKQYDKARDYLTRYIAAAPENWAYERLAANFLEQGDHDGWLKTLDEYLERGEDHGLDHAKVRVQLANHYMNRGEWLKAQPYADAAAKTWAGWAMQGAARCHEGMQDWEQAELWTRRLSERYPNTSAFAWFLFCKRTGHGDLAAAREFTDQYLAAAGDQPGVADPVEIGFYYWASGSPAKARDAFRDAFEARQPIVAGFALVLLADELGDPALRDAVMEEICTKHQKQAPRMVEVFQMFRAAIARGPYETPDLKAVDKLIESARPESRGNFAFWVGWLLRKHGKPEDATAYLKRCTETPNTYVWQWFLAADALRSATGGSSEPAEARADPQK